MEHGTLTEYLGNYTYYREKKKDLEEFEKDRNGGVLAEIEKEEKPVKPEEPRQHEEKNEVSQTVLAKIDHLEMEISRQEATVKMYEIEMNAAAADPEAYEAASAQYEEEKKKLDALYEKWEEATEKSN